MTNRERFVAAFFEGSLEVGYFEQSFASDTASQLLGRKAFTGSVQLHYQQAVAAVAGETAYEDFLEQVKQDTLALAQLLEWGALSEPWLIGKPSKQVSEYEFLYGDEAGEWTLYRYDPRSGNYGPVKWSTRPAWRGREAWQAKVEWLESYAENFASTGAEDLRRRLRNWRQLAGEDFEPLCEAAMLSLPLDEEALTACALAPDLVAAYLDAQVEIGLKQLEIVAAEGYRILWSGGDLADNHGPLYGPRFFEQVVFPRLAKLIKAAHDLDLRYLFRSDGNLWPIADLLFGPDGVDAYGEIDVDAGMEIPALQARFPQLTCWGNLSCDLVRTGKAEAVKEAALALLEAGKPCGRLVLGTSNTVLPGTPPENVLALLEAARTTWCN